MDQIISLPGGSAALTSEIRAVYTLPPDKDDRSGVVRKPWRVAIKLFGYALIEMRVESQTEAERLRDRVIAEWLRCLTT